MLLRFWGIVDTQRIKHHITGGHTMKILLSTFLLAFGIFVLTYQPVAAAPVWKEGYVCSVQYYIQNHVAYGKPVRLTAFVKSAPHCGGSNVVEAQFKHYGGTALGRNYSRAELLAHLQTLHQAAIHGTKVKVYMDDAPGSAIYYIRIFGN